MTDYHPLLSLFIFFLITLNFSCFWFSLVFIYFRFSFNFFKFIFLHFIYFFNVEHGTNRKNLILTVGLKIKALSLS